MVLKSGKSLYTIHAHDDSIGPINWKNLSTLRICSIDMGRVNFGMQIETRTYSKNKLSVIREVILKEKFIPAKKSGICHFYKQFTDFIYQHEQLLKTCRLVIIEKQLPMVKRKGKSEPGNTKTYRDMQHLITLFQFFPFKHPCHIVELSARVKTKYLQCPDSVQNIKSWCIKTAKELIELADDDLGRRAMESLTDQGEKLDEVGDVICQAEALMQLVAIDTKDYRFCLMELD